MSIMKSLIWPTKRLYIQLDFADKLANKKLLQNNVLHHKPTDNVC